MICKIAIPTINSGTSVNLNFKEARMASRNIQNPIHVVIIRFAVVFELLVFCS